MSLASSFILRSHRGAPGMSWLLPPNPRPGDSTPPRTASRGLGAANGAPAVTELAVGGRRQQSKTIPWRLDPDRRADGRRADFNGAPEPHLDIRPNEDSLRVFGKLEGWQNQLSADALAS